jgi:hypothetical protein
MTAPDSPNAPAHEPHPCPENTPEDVDPATKLLERQKPDEHNGEHLIEKDPPGDCPT